MLNLNELEKKWFVYKIKSYIPHLTITTTLILIIIVVLFYFDDSLKDQRDIEKKEVKKLETHKTFVKEIKKVPLSAPIPITKKNNLKKTLLLPSLNFVENITINKKKMQEPIIENTEKIVEIKPEPIIKEISIEKNISLQIKKQNTSNDINLVIKRFKTNNNPALSLFIAKKYYEIGNFNQAYNYSLITNQLNKDIEESWIIFSKSLVKLDKKNKAIKVLKQYLEYSNSNKAEILLANILSGKFK